MNKVAQTLSLKLLKLSDKIIEYAENSNKLIELLLMDKNNSH